MICSNCRKEISESSKFCRFCGTKIEEIYCEKCGTRLEPDSLFCSECGASAAKGGEKDGSFGGFRWEEDSRGEIFITGHYGNSGVVNIPPVINGKRVTEICAGAFSDNKIITSVNIPASVARIGSRAFRKCSSLVSVSLPDGITEIGREMFYECVSLTSVNIPDSVRTIEEAAFLRCTSLKSISLPNGLTDICESAFRECEKLTDITIPDSVRTIGTYALLGCRSPEIKYKGKAYKTDHQQYYDGFSELYDAINTCKK